VFEIGHRSSRDTCRSLHGLKPLILSTLCLLSPTMNTLNRFSDKRNFHADLSAVVSSIRPPKVPSSSLLFYCRGPPFPSHVPLINSLNSAGYPPSLLEKDSYELPSSFFRPAQRPFSFFNRFFCSSTPPLAMSVRSPVVFSSVCSFFHLCLSFSSARGETRVFYQGKCGSL